MVIREDDIKVLFELLRASAIDKKLSIPSTKDVNWSNLRTLASDNGILAFVWDGIVKLEKEKQPSRFQRIEWSLSAQEIWNRYKKQTEVLQQIVSVCSANDVKIMLLKGIPLSKMFPNPQSRPSGDIDVYFFDDFEKGNRLFSQISRETVLHTEFEYEGVHIENHKTFIYPNTKTKKRISDYLENNTDKVVLTDDGYYVFAPLQNLVYLMMHMLNHAHFDADSAFLNLRNVLDLAMFFHTNQELLDPEETIALMKKLQFERPFELVLYLSEWLLEIDLSKYHQGVIPQRTVEKIRKMFLSTALYMPVSSNDSILRQLYYALKRYFKLRAVYNYMPKRNKSFVGFTIRHQLSLIRNKV